MQRTNKHTKNFSTALVIREIQIKTTMKHHFIPIRLDIMIVILKREKITSVGEDVEKLEPSYTTGGNVKWGSHFGRPSVSSSNNLTIQPSNSTNRVLQNGNRELRKSIYKPSSLSLVIFRFPLAFLIQCS